MSVYIQMFLALWFVIFVISLFLIVGQPSYYPPKDRAIHASMIFGFLLAGAIVCTVYAVHLIVQVT